MMALSAGMTGQSTVVDDQVPAVDGKPPVVNRQLPMVPEESVFVATKCCQLNSNC